MKQLAGSRPHRKTWGALLAVLLFAGCISSSENEVVVLSALDREFSEPILNDVGRELGFVVRTKFDAESNKSVGLTTEIIQNQKRPRADLFWNNEILNTIRLQELGLLEVYLPTRADQFPQKFQAEDRTWYGLAARARVLIVNTDLLQNQANYPQSLQAFAESKYRKRCTIARPLFGTSATHAASLFAVLGDESATELYRAIAANVVVQGGNKQVAEKVSRGEFLFGLTDTDDAMIEIEKGRPVAMVFPDQAEGQSGTLLIPNTLCLIKGGPNPEAAKRLMNRLLQADVERRLAVGKSAQWPLARDCDVVPRKFPTTLKVMQVDFAKAADRWQAAMQVMNELFPIGG